MKDSSSNFRLYVEKIMEERNLSIEQINTIINRNNGYMQKVMDNKNFNPTIDTILLLSYAFDIDYRNLLDKHPYNYFCRELLMPAMSKKKMTVDELSKKTGIDKRAIIDFYVNNDLTPSFKRVVKMANALGENPNVWMLSIGNYGFRNKSIKYIKE